MSRLLFRLATVLLILCVLGTVQVARAADYTFGDFEGFVYALGDQFGPNSTSSTSGYINNGNPGSGQPDGPNNSNYYFNNAGHQTGWGDWLNGSVMSNTTTGVTSGSTAIKIQPLSSFSQNLAVKLQALPNAEGIPAFDAFMENTHVAVDITWDPAEWGTVAPQEFGSRIILYMNQGPTSTPLSDGIGFREIGAYVPDDPNGFRVPDIDTGNPDNPGFWDEINYPALHTRTVYWDYSNYTPDGTTYYDLRDLVNTSTTNGSAGWLEFLLTEITNDQYTSHAYNVDNFRFTSLVANDGDLDDDGDIDDNDIDTLWNVIRPELVGSDDPNANDDEDLNQDGFVNEDDVDYMLAALLTAGPNRQYGDADLDGGVGGLDYTAWRLRAGTGWANGDFDGDGGVGGLDYTLWRTRPTAYPTTIGPHPGGSLAAVPEPTTCVLGVLGATGAILLRGRKRYDQRAGESSF